MVKKTQLSRVEFDVSAAGSGAPSILYLHSEVSVAPDPLLGLLQQRHHVVAPVHPGYGEAPRPDWVETVRDLADLYLDLVDEHCSSEPVVVVGSSVGGWIAAELVLLTPARVAHLVLLGPAGLFDANALAADHWFVTEEERAKILFLETDHAPQVSIEEWVANDEMTALLAWNPRFADLTLAPRLARLRVPTTILWGASDRLLPPLLARSWSAALPHAQLREVDGSGHFVNYEQPSLAADIIESALEGVS